MSPVSSCGSCPDQHCRASTHVKPAIPYQQQVNHRPEKTEAPPKQYSIEGYRVQRDHHQAFLVEAPTLPSRSASEMRRELDQWEASWQRMGGSPPLGFVMTANDPSTTQNLNAQSRRRRDCERKMGGCRDCIIRLGYTKPRKFVWKESRPIVLPQWSSCN